MGKINCSAFRGLFFIFLAIILCNVLIQAQEPTQQEFPIGASLSGEPGQGVLASFDTSGLNTVSWRANSNTSDFLENYKVWANNPGWTDWIQYYATCYYSRWEGEQDTTIEHIGVKHEAGKRTIWKNTDCWSSLDVSAPVCSLMYGPHYRQDQRYKSYFHTGNIWGVEYVPRFNLALDNPHLLNPDRDVCIIKVVYRYAEIDISVPPPFPYEVKDTIFLQDTLKISDFPTDGSFKIFEVIENGLNYYSYPEKFQSAITGERVAMSPTYTDLPAPPGTEFIYSDRNDNNGIQFCVDYLGNDSTTLYIDYAEVYDNNGWNNYILDPQTVIDNIQSYTQSYSDWDNIIYWYGQDEPYSQDSFLPIHIVDTLVQYFGGAPVTQYFQPDWRILVNGDTFMVDYYRKAKPPELIIDPYPFSPDYYPVRVESLESLKDQFQIASSLKPGFWFIGQGFGEEINGEPYIWRSPDPEELKATIMLALAHGSKGILFWNYDSYSTQGGVYVLGIVEEDGSPTDLWYLIHDNFVPRLKGTLGNTLLGLDYRGDFLNVEYQEGPPPEDYEHDYLSIQHYGMSYFWHAGFLVDSLHFDNKYFLLTNLRTSFPVEAKLIVSNNTDFQNVSFTDIEGGEGRVDTTIAYNTSITYFEEMPAGEGRLYRVAPVLKYGGKLITNDTVTTNINLIDNMIIRNGAVATIEDGKEYTALDTIKLEGTGFISGDGYFDRGESGWVILDSWDQSVFKGR